VPSSNDRPLRFIIAYKSVRAAGALVLALVLAALTVGGLGAPLRSFASGIRAHATTAWGMRLSDLLLSAAAPRHLWIIVGALAVDGVVTFLEAWSLHRRWWWGPWLVVAITAALLPIEVVSLARHATAGRVLILGANVAVAAYLAEAALRKRLGSTAPRSL
jgi:uncharacterized membrane protein (DUF2068 family)